MANPRPIGYFDEAVVQHEFRAKFHNCYVLLEHPSMPLEYWSIDAANDGMDVYFHNKNDELFNITGGIITTELEIVVKFPENGWYLCPETNYAFLISRYPAKQWRRAPNKENMHCSVFRGDTRIEAVHLSAALLNLTLFPVDEIVGKFKVINRKYLLSRTNAEWSSLFYMNAHIGYYNHVQNKFFMFHSWYRLPSTLFKNVVYPKTFSLKI